MSYVSLSVHRVTGILVKEPRAYPLSTGTTSYSQTILINDEHGQALELVLYSYGAPVGLPAFDTASEVQS